MRTKQKRKTGKEQYINAATVMVTGELTILSLLYEAPDCYSSLENNYPNQEKRPFENGETMVNDVEVCHTDEERSGEIQRRVLLIIIDRRRLIAVCRYQPFRQIHLASVLTKIARLISMLPRIIIIERADGCPYLILIPTTHQAFINRINKERCTFASFHNQPGMSCSFIFIH